MIRFASAMLVFVATLCSAQGNTAPVPQGQTPRLQLDSMDHDAYLAVLSIGPGWANQGDGLSPTGQFAASVGTSTLLSDYGRSGGQGFLEVGALGPLPDRAAPAAFIGYNLAVNHVFTPRPRNVFFLTGGIDYVFTQAGALNGGFGVDHYYKEGRAIRFEVRDYIVFTERPQNTVAVRVGWVFSVHDP